MADNDRDANKISKKDAKREAKIEAKRRKLAQQRAEREAAAAAAGEPAAVNNESSTLRPVTADTSNRERRPVSSLLSSSEKQAAERKARQESAAENEPVKAEPEPAAKAAANSAQTAANAAQANVNKAAENKAVENEAAENESAASEPAGKKQPPRRKNETAKKAGAYIVSKIKALRDVKWTRRKIITCLAILAAVVIGIFCIADVVEQNSRETDIVVTDEGFDHAGKFDSCAIINGIDISEHQEGKIDWNKVKSSGVDFVFIRCGYRAADDGSLHADSAFASNYKKAKKAGLMVGTYFYSQALNADEGKAEAEFVLDIIKDHEMTMPVVIDYEIYKGGRLDKRIQAGEMYAASFYHDAVLGFTNTVEEAGYESAVYASRDMLTNYMQADLLDDMATIWLARYDKIANLDANYWLWQSTDKGAVGGIEGDVDSSFWYIEPNKIYPTRAKHPENAVSVGDCRISFQRSKTKLRNMRADPKFAMTYEGQGMTEGRDYVSSVVNNTHTGTGYVIVRGIGDYKDWIMYPFTIE